MSSLKDKFDDFREEPQYATWQQLLNRLNAEMPVKRKRRYLLWLLPLFLAGTTAAGWLFAAERTSVSGKAHEPNQMEYVAKLNIVRATPAATASNNTIQTSIPGVNSTNSVRVGNNVNDQPILTDSVIYNNPDLAPTPSITRVKNTLQLIPSRPGPLPLNEPAWAARIDDKKMIVEFPEARTLDSVEYPVLKPPSNDFKFVLGFDYAPGVSNFILRDPLIHIINTKETTSNRQLRDNISKAGFSQSFGVILKMNIQPNIRLKTGYYFTFINQTLYYNTQDAKCNCGDSISLGQVAAIKQSDMSNKSDSISVGNTNSFTNKYSLREIPFIVEYSLPMLKHPRMSYTFNVGASFMFMRGVNVRIPDADNVGFISTVNKNSNVYTFPSYQNAVNGIVGLGFNYKANRNVEYSIAPQFKMALTSLSKNNAWLREYPWQFHVSFGIGKRF